MTFLFKVKLFLMCSSFVDRLTMGQDKNVANLRQLARECIRDGRQTEAFFHLSHAIKMDETNCDLLSDRSKCSVDSIQYHFALEDAEQIIKLRPDTWLGHVRLAEVYHATFNFDLAIPCYQRAFQCLDADKSHCKMMIDKCKKELSLDKQADM